MAVKLIRRQRRSRHEKGNLLLHLMGAVLAANLLLVALTLGTMLVATAGVYYYYARDLPPAEEIGLRTAEAFETTRIYDRTGEHVLYEILDPEGGFRTMVPLQQIPLHLRNATIALEEKTFYENPVGVDLGGILRAFINNLRGLPVQGASSITQQLVRNVVMTPEERFTISYARKIKEAILAYELSRRYPGLEGKDQILEWYLNTVHYGGLAYGVQAAAETYFEKDVEDLTLAECAMLAPIPQYPLLNPIDDFEAAKKRQELYLEQMHLQGYITAEEAEAAKNEEIKVVPQRFDIDAPHFVMYVRELLVEKYGAETVYGGGLQVRTTLDFDIQKEAERIARNHIAEISEQHNVSNASVVVIRPETGEILAMMGSLDYFDTSIDGQVNVSISPRQPGSSFKPFTYATALARGYTAATLIMDVRTSFPDVGGIPYVPENYTRKFYGPILLRRAVAWSLNVPAVAMLHELGLSDVLDTAHRMGISTLTSGEYGLSLTLGGGEVKLIDMVYAFSVFANGGIMAGEPVPEERLEPGFRELDPVAILEIKDSRGNVLEEFKGPRTREVLRPQVAFLMNDILSDNNARARMFGVDSPLHLERQVAAKTGSTNNYRDAWTIGFTPQVAVGVWVGNSDNTEMKSLPGVRGAGPIWHDLMEYILEPLPVVEFAEPPGLTRMVVDATSGLLPTEYSPSRITELFIRGTEPTSYDNVHRPFRICKTSGKLATIYCPPDQTEEVVFDIFPPGTEDWVRESEIPQPPGEYCDIHGPNLAASDVAITSPQAYSSVRGEVPILGNAKPSRFKLFRLQYGEGMDPSSWTQIGGERYDKVDNNVLGHWDTSALDGLYSVKLTVIDKDNHYRETAVPISVDNISPTVKILHPEDHAIYVMERDEWVNFQVEAEDNTSMDRVEFYLDGQMFDFTTVAPYTKRWTIAMSDTVPVGITLPDPNVAIPETVVEGDRVTFSRLITSENTIDFTQIITVGNQVTATHILSQDDYLRVTRSFPSGRAIISDTMGYTETHSIYIIAFDAAGNELKSETLTILIVHEEEEGEEKPASPTTTMLGTSELWRWMPPPARRKWLTG